MTTIASIVRGMMAAVSAHSDSYDDELWRLVPDDPGPPPSHLVQFVRGLGPSSRALDLGCGDGRLAEELRADDLTLADVSGVALQRALERHPGAQPLKLAQDGRIPMEDSLFDLVLCVETIEHVRDVQLLLSEIRRVLQPGGALALTTPAHGRLTGLEILLRGFDGRFDPLSPHIRFFSARSLRRALEEHGFDVLTLRRVSGTLMAEASR